MQSQRIDAIDSARGAAMVLVCLSHFAWVHLDLGGRGDLAAWLTAVSQVASPSFMIISGVMAGFLVRNSRGGPGKATARLVDRGIFLLTIGHGVLLAANSLRSAPGRSPLLWLFLTDTIAVSLLAAAYLIPRTSARARVLGGGAIYCASLLAAAFWRPAGAWAAALLDTLAGTSGPSLWNHHTPVLPWLGIFLASTALGERLVEPGQAGVSRSLLRRARSLGMGAVALGVGLRLLFHAAQRSGAFAPLLLRRLDFLLSPWQKTPPSLVYLLLFGGAGLLLLVAVFAASERDLLPTARAWLTLLGRTSLFIFMLQAWIFYVLMYRFPIPVTEWWPLLFAAVLGIVTLAAYAWRESNGNRLLTVGWHRRRAAPAAAPPRPPAAPPRWSSVAGGWPLPPIPRRTEHESYEPIS